MNGQVPNRRQVNASPRDGRLGCSASQNKTRAELAAHEEVGILPGLV